MVEPPAFGSERVFIASIHWNNEAILRSHWIPAVLELVKEIGKDNVYISVLESGSWDNSKGALRELDVKLGELGVNRKIVLDDTTHADEIAKPPTKEGWIHTPRVAKGEKELRRIPYLARLRNEVLQPLYDLQSNGVEKFDKILWLNDVVFSTHDVRNLFATRGGDYAAACSLDFSKGNGQLYDTFALRDSEGREQVMSKWPYFRARESRKAIKANHPAPVASCWNGMVVMHAAPFYNSETPLVFRGISDSLADSHLEGSECCLIHADNPLSRTKGVWINPGVRVGYNAPAYEAINPPGAGTWVSTFGIVYGSWENRLRRWFTTTWLKEMLVKRRLAAWEKESKLNLESGPFCLINEMQVLIKNGWAHV
ncbi:related to polysaccharide export protein (CAP59) [Ramularia collo-cygni]|uniref:Related to polysaccharide export protein (CAP59) n=1 Tax=Ramularia collo-cygni TaxID=112498 RepID=A0A2D3VMG5_9PEZI|nr:related to polysaccharide export protein (CAP59) [Ramularia collo-cygni]CZT23944.1 related to polysaccharide export protein (CAP59) [Ramularia collo-cygni]